MLRRLGTASSAGSAVASTCGVAVQKRFDTTRMYGPEEDPEAPKEELRKRAKRKLWDAERMISVAPDYGSCMIMAMLNDGRQMIQDIQLEMKRGGIQEDEDLNEKVEELLDLAKKIEFDFELD